MAEPTPPEHRPAPHHDDQARQAPIKPDHLPSQETVDTEKGVAAGILGTLGCGAVSLLPFTAGIAAILFVVILYALRGCG